MSPGSPVYLERSIVSAPAGMAAASVVTFLILSPSMSTIAFVHTLPLASQSFPNRTALTAFAFDFSCAAAVPTCDTACPTGRIRRIRFLAYTPSLACTSEMRRTSSNSLVSGMQPQITEDQFRRCAACAEGGVNLELLEEGSGGAAPAVSEPRPNC